MHPYRVRDLEALRQALADSKREVPHSVRSLAEIAGTSHGTIGNILTGVQERVSEEVAQRVAQALATPFDDLFVRAAYTSCDSDRTRHSS